MGYATRSFRRYSFGGRELHTHGRRTLTQREAKVDMPVAWPILPRKVAIAALGVGHIVAGLVLGYLTQPRPVAITATFFAAVFAQISLLGLWAGLSARDWTFRGTVAILGAILLAYELGWGIDNFNFTIIFLALLPSCVVSLVACGARAFGNLQRSPVDDGEQEALQFGIRHLFALTFVVACLVAVGKAVAPVLASAGTMVVVSILGLGYATVGLTSIWALFGTGSPLFRSVMVIAIAATAGAVGGSVVDGGGDMSFWITTTGLQAALLVGTLAVFRCYGYRFVSRRDGANSL